MLQGFVALVSGVVFAVGLAVGGMTDPARIKGFLDVFGTWDPTLVFVMAGAVGVAFFGGMAATKRGAPYLGPAFHPPGTSAIDNRLVVGSALFGVGWGLSGFCPGPAIAAVVGGFPSVLVFLAAMAATMFIHDRLPWGGGAAKPLAVEADG